MEDGVFAKAPGMRLANVCGAAQFILTLTQAPPAATAAGDQASEHQNE
jgi:hypothetical protein